MKYIFTFLAITVFLIPLQAHTQEENIKIIPRINWEANELFTSLDDVYWKNILEARRNATPRPVNQQLLEEQRLNQARAIEYINENFSRENTITQTVTHDVRDGFRLAWPHRYTDYVNAIIVHHTTGTYDSDIEALRNIYRFHSLSRGWGDIGYNYIIGLNGDIYEGKKGGDYVVGAHSKWNNNSTVGISVIGDYSERGVNLDQYDALRDLIKHLTWKYGIDTGKNYYYHMDCYKEHCDTFPLITRREGRLVGHRDTGNTTCPGDALYAQLMFLKREIDEFSRGFVPVRRGEESIGERDLTRIITTSYDSHALRFLQPLSYEELTMIQARLTVIDANKLSKKSQDLLISLKKITHILLDIKKS
ncbi:N-acetylmuramoyl-L-alanine amidase [Candidatus Gracilibacteria bacterium]|nr:N-acetylmuramoyl-L-alanine amidase [Candidatus Gracilibacteria bacterium]